MALFAPIGSVQQQSASQSARKGIERGLDMYANAAQRIAESGASEPVGLAEAAVQVLEARTLIRASGKLMQAADRTLGSLINLRA